jgi:hypothetical protein
VQQEVAWSGLVTMDIEDDLLFSDERLCFSVFQKRHLWSTRVIGYAFVSLKDAFSRPGVSMQVNYTHPGAYIHRCIDTRTHKPEAHSRSHMCLTMLCCSSCTACGLVPLL